MSSSSSSSYTVVVSNCVGNLTVWTVLRWLLLLVIAFLSYNAIADPDFIPEWTDRGMWAYFGRWLKRMVVDPPETPFSADDQNILFVGNSYTGYYELHKLTQQCLIAGQQSEDRDDKSLWDTRTINVEAHFPGGQTFEGHLGGLNRPPYLGKHHVMHKWLISNAEIRHWKWVVLQNHSLRGGYCKSPDPKHKEIYDKSVENAKELNNIVVKNNPLANTIFFMTWGRREHYAGVPEEYTDFLTMQDMTAQGYLQYVQTTSTPERPTYLAPVGLVFKTIYLDDKKKAGDNGKDPSQDESTLFFQLLDYEGHHPALPGTYTAAVTFYATLTGKDPTKMKWKPDRVTEEQAVNIRDAVHRTIQETAKSGLIRYPWQKTTTGSKNEGGHHN